MAYLVLTEGDRKGHKFDLKDGVTRIGRRAENDVILVYPSVSGTHAEIIRSDDGFELRDLGSTNGTRLNGSRIQSIRVYRNDIFSFGDISVMLEGDDVPTAPPSDENDAADISSIPRTTVSLHPLVPENARVMPPSDFKKTHGSRTLWPIFIGLVILAVLVALVVFVLGFFS
ncbi:MAG: FHA domain-containing protein [Lentisphaerae bacterium]|nr:FHA domain-containing protein [Lentisphaerota bacterium]